MPAWDSDIGGKFVFLPKIGGEGITFKIKITKRVDGPSKNNLKGKDHSDLGYHYQMITDGDRIVTVNSWVFVRALAGANAQEGDTVSVSRPERGKYIVTKKSIERGASQPTDLGYLKDLEKKYTEKTEW